MNEEPLAYKRSSLRSLVALVTAITGLVTAIAALRKPPEEPANKVSYETLQKAVDDLNKEDQGLRTDLVNLRNSFAEYVQVKEGSSAFVPSVASSASAAPLTIEVTPSFLLSGKPSSAVATQEKTKVIVPVPKSSSSAAPKLPPYSDIKQQAGL